MHESIEVLENLTDHSDKLRIILNTAKSVMTEFNKDKDIGNNCLITPKKVDQIDVILTKCLHKAALLSTSINDVEFELKEYYEETYQHAPAMGRKLFFEHYYQLHKPYDKVKNYIWKNLFYLDHYRKEKF